MKKRTTRRALVMSLLSLLLCCSMLVGTTFAWFTDSVTSGQNKIIAGNLDVDVYYGDPAAENSINNVATLFNDVTLWEPGAVAWENLTVVNLGTLALKYELAVNFADQNYVEGTNAKLSEALKVAVVEPIAANATREQVLTAAGEGTPLASFTESGKLLPKDSTLVVEGAVKEAKTYGIVIWWEPSAEDNKWNVQNGAKTNDDEPLQIDLGINLVATQLQAEEDSFDETYDKNAVYADVTASTAAELEAAIAAGKKIIGVQGTITMTKSLGATGVTFIGATNDAAIDFGAYGISGLDNTFKGLTLDNDRDGWYKGMQYSDGENTTYEECVFVNGVTTYGNSTFKGCTFNELPAGNYALFAYDGANIIVDNCVFNYGNRAIKIYSEGPSNREMIISNTAFKASATSNPNKAMIEIDDTFMTSVKVDVKNITMDSAIAAQGIYRINDGPLNTSTAKSVVSVDGAVTSVKAAAQTELTDALAGGDVAIELAAGEYTMPSVTGTKEITITGTKDTVIDNTMGSYMDSSKISFEGVTIKGSTGMANGNGSDYAALYSPNVTYTNCTFEGPFRIGRDGATFIGCTFTKLGNDYVWTYGNDCTFIDCTFNSDGKALLIYSDGGTEVSKVTVKDCTFNATKGAKAGAISNQNCAAIEIQNYGNGVNLTTSGNTIDTEFSGEWRIKTYHADRTDVIVNGVTYTSLALDGKLMTISGTTVTVQ